MDGSLERPLLAYAFSHIGWVRYDMRFGLTVYH